MYPTTLLIAGTCITSVLGSYHESSELQRTAEHYANLTKRWYSVKELHPLMVVDGWGPWPLMCPDGDTQTQPVRYCFKDARSQTNLQSTVDEAVARWAHAIQVSALEIDFDNQNSKVCSGQNRPDALVIWDATIDDNDDYNWNKYFCHLEPGSTDSKDEAVRAMMHELGHVIGLVHEHQRSDRNQFLCFRCQSLEGYDAGVRAAAIDDRALFEEATDETDRVNLICNDRLFADAYLPEAVPFIRGDWMGDEERWSTYATSNAFDYTSIMIYHSNSGSDDPTKASMYVIWRKDNKRSVWMGGSPDPTKATISAGDIARVAQLYPKGDGSSSQAMNSNNWGPVNVKIRDVFERIVHPPAIRSMGEL